MTHNKTRDIIGLDLGINNLVTMSDGTKIDNPKFLQKLEQRISHEQHCLSKKKVGSKNWNKQRVRLSKVYRKLRYQRLDFIHKITSNLVKTKQEIVIESLSISDMVKGSVLSKSIYSASWGELIRQLRYKSLMHNMLVTEVDRFFPSSKLCSNCGIKNENLKLHHRSWKCSNCGMIHDRDINAAINLKNQLKSVGWVTPEITLVELPTSG